MDHHFDDCTPVMKRRICYCGELPILKTSWTEINPGRRFWGCRFYGKVGCCDFFEWADPAPHERYKSVINGLLRKRNEVDKEKVNIGKTARFYKIALWLLVLFVVLRSVF
ncbi:GRF-type domain-containing protein [Abeliophyllum distichum]|uniref:GRF-type domain-containing protein n=1 Tax=Abeliophyllum distichum TaxID=126358 RepID=A0ABD1PMI5_9LAMI